MTASADAKAASSAVKPPAVNSAQQNEPAETPSARATPCLRPALIDVPMTARTFGPGLASPSRHAEYASMMPGRYGDSWFILRALDSTGHRLNLGLTPRPGFG